MPADVDMIELTDEPIDVSRVLAAVSDPHSGAETLFVGSTRQWTAPPATGSPAAIPGLLETSHLFYECHQPLAIAEMTRIAAAARQRWPIRKLAIIHRIGRVDPLQASVAIAVSCPHRSHAFEATRWIIDTLKQEVPIWKQEHYVQSGPQWIHV